MTVQCDSMLDSVRRLWQFDLLGMRYDSLFITQKAGAGVYQSADNAGNVQELSFGLSQYPRKSGPSGVKVVVIVVVQLVMDDGVELIHGGEVEIWMCSLLYCVVLMSTRSGAVDATQTCGEEEMALHRYKSPMLITSGNTFTSRSGLA